MFTRILIATDFSEPSKLAAQAARSLAEAYGIPITLLHVTDLDDTDEQRIKANELLEAFKSDTLGDDGDVELLVADHRRADVAITGAATKRKADLIVVGREGAHSITEHLLGSTTERVARHADCSVLVVQSEHASLASQVVACSDLSNESVRAIEEAGELASRFDGALTLAHVYTVEAPPFAYAPGETRRNEGMEKKASDALEKLRADKLGEQKATIDVREHQSAVAGLCDIAREKNADLMAVGTRGRTGLERLLIGSVAERIIRHAPCSVLVARP